MITRRRMERDKKKILLGMSGGVDSSVSAHILQEQGYEVVGLTLNMLKCKEDTYKDVKDVCDKLGIEHISMELKDEFDKNIVKYFVTEYLNGRTPNPCVLCNKEFKFEKMLEKANELGIEYVATGHYVRLEKKQNRYVLKKATDRSKDQSYVLYKLSQEQLSRCMFPLGDYTKEDIRSIAKSLGLGNANKPDSQDICFVENNDYSALIPKTNTREGDIVDTKGNILGKHTGIHNYTVGQRKGIGISSNKALYVVRIDIDENRVVVGREKDIYSKVLTATDINWICVPKRFMLVKTRIRYHAKEAWAIMHNKGDRVSVKFLKPQRAITPGQAVVFYKGDYVLGGGTIE